MKRFAFVCLALTGFVAAAGTFQSGRTSFELDIAGLRDGYAVRSTSVMPGESLALSAWQAGKPRSMQVAAAEGSLRRLSSGVWSWRAPTTLGSYVLTVDTGESAGRATVRVFVLVPYRRMQGGMLNGFAIGGYPARHDGYARPRGFIEVTEANQGVFVSPHFRLGQFLCKQAGGFPKYVLLSERLLGKLERLLEKVNAAGVREDTLYVMSGYRTPRYNRSLGNVSLSRHVYGDAADVFPDGHPTAGMMVDLNGDGKIDIEDSRIFLGWVEELEARESVRFPAGGVGIYEATAAHGPFVHVDARGRRARWSGNVMPALWKPR